MLIRWTHCLREKWKENSAGCVERMHNKFFFFYILFIFFASFARNLYRLVHCAFLFLPSAGVSQTWEFQEGKTKLGATADIGGSDERAEMDRAGAEGAPGLLLCSLLLKTLRSLLMVGVCCPLIARIQLLSGDLEATGAELKSCCNRKLSLSMSSRFSLR